MEKKIQKKNEPRGGRNEHNYVKRGKGKKKKNGYSTRNLQKESRRVKKMRKRKQDKAEKERRSDVDPKRVGKRKSGE